ncbi:hypothetical protein [Paraburkholderia ultramafica]|nr:hypothetical protein [Paraburkholderia ultramafica]
MVDNVNGGRLQAVGGDEIHCKCAQAPRIIAVYGRSWTIQNNSDSETRTVASRATSQSAPSVIYDEQFTLKDGNGMPLPDTYYTIRLPSGELAHGVTDSQGRTERYPTSDAQQISIPVGHNREH